MEENTNEQSISIKSLWIILKNNFLWIFLFTFVVTLAGGIYGLFFKPYTYTSTAQLLVQAEEGTSSTQSNEYTYSVNLVYTFKEWIVSDPVLEDVVEKFKDTEYATSKAALSKAITVTAGTTNLIITVNYKSSDEEKTSAIINQLVKSAIAVADTYKTDEAGNIIVEKDKDNVEHKVFKYRILSEKLEVMSVSDKPTAKRGAAKVILICGIAGLVLSYGFFLVKYLVDDTYRSRADFEMMTGIKVLASIPDTQDGTTKKSNKLTEAKGRGRG